MNYFAYPHAGAWAVVYVVPGTMALAVHEIGYPRVELANARAAELNWHATVSSQNVHSTIAATT